MSIVLSTPGATGLEETVSSLREWQVDGASMQLHPGDLGWHWRDGAERTAADVRVWSRSGRIAAIGLLDAPQLVRMAVAPDLQHDQELIGRIATDLDGSGHDVLAAGDAVVEARCGPLLTEVLLDRGWSPDEPWTPLHRGLAEPVPASGLRVETVGPDAADDWAAVHWSAFRETVMTDDDRRTARQRWIEMAAGTPYADARCLIAFDEHGDAVAVAGVWSAGRARPGLLEPIGVDADHRGHGHGRAITLAAATALRDMGCSSATVCTPGSRSAAVATYVSAGFHRLPDVRDLRRGEIRPSG